ncbi:hypothetical protein F0U44_05800 [Nocardioides humilatus]|uniref:DUF559 domain-containing protein n=1 Tax=Nocardioides humilatus TaxID=2607660 RepID=A0A5B1LM78_9ACTN|nr:hypothetical protein [Nocardioides humilatus]KAA1421782.1 hypothetical protein F0U44_05800 [Nocardioides humilatus]
MPSSFPPDRPFTAADLPSYDATRQQLRGLLQCGVVKQLLFGVYVPGTWADTPTNRARAAAAVLPDHCVLVDRTAASLHGIDVFDYAELDVPPDVEVASIDGATATRRSGFLGGKRDLLADEIMTIEGARVTTPIRTACDIACLRGRRRAIGVLDAFRARFGITESELSFMLRRFGGRRGVTQLRELIPLSRPDVDSQPESWIRIDINDEGFPMPESQVWVWLPDGRQVRVENAFEHLRIAVEYDGEAHHSSEADRNHDRVRRDALADAGWIIIVVRREGLTDLGRNQWLAELEAAFVDRAPHLATKRAYARSPLTRPRRHRRR